MTKPLYRLAERAALIVSCAIVLLPMTAYAQSNASKTCGEFTIAVIPDTQNYLDYRDQKAAGFPLDAVNLFYDQMRYIAAHATSAGGDIQFAVALGDVKQHFSLWMDPEHVARGFRAVPNEPTSEVAAGPREKEVRTIEMPYALEGYRLIKGKLPFSVVPGNHDYDALWTDPRLAPELVQNRMTYGRREVGGLSTFQFAFSDQSEFFKGEPWYVSSHDGGADNAQLFTAGGCRFLNIGLQFTAPNSSLEWAAGVIKRYPGVPTLISIHGYLDHTGTRLSNSGNKVDPLTNDPQMVWEKFISQNDQIFMVLSGHACGQAYRVDANRFGHDVHQLLSDYQCRGQVAKDAGVDLREGPGANWLHPSGLGDGWMRMMTFSFDGNEPAVHVRTFSTYYKMFSTEVKAYASWYKKDDEQSLLSDDEFVKRDDFIFVLKDYYKRFHATEKPAAHKEGS